MSSDGASANLRAVRTSPKRSCVQHHTVERRRSARTLEALSIALGWHPQHLDAVLHGRRPHDLGEPVSNTEDSVWSRLETIDERLSEITDLLYEMNAKLGKVVGDGRITE